MVSKFKVTVAGTHGGRPARMYVTSVQFADGDGFKLKRFSYTSDPCKAHTFGERAAREIGQQLAGRYDDVRLVSGAEETAVPISEEQKHERAMAQEFARMVASGDWLNAAKWRGGAR